MAVETAKDKIKIHQIVGQKQEILNVDGDVIVNDIKPDVLKIISTNGTICLYKKEILNGKIKLEGCINTYIIYLADDEEASIRTINTSLDFAEIIDMEYCSEQMTLDENLCIKGFETKVLNGRKLHVKAFIDANLKVYSNSDIETIVDIKDEKEEIQMLDCKKNVMSLIGENTGKTTLKDTININPEDDLAELMKVDFSVSDIETKTSYNKILIKANANIGIMYLTEDNRIGQVNSKIPLMGFIDMPNVSDTSQCSAKVKLKNLVIKPNNTEEHNLYVEADMDLFCMAYESKQINIIEDAYSTLNDVDLKRNSVRTTTEQFELRDELTVRQRLSDPDLLYARILGANLTPTIENTDIRDGKIRYEGKVNAEIIASMDNNVNNVNVEIPFNFELISDRVNLNDNVETQVNVISQNIINADDGVTLEVKLQLAAVLQKNEELNFAQDLTVMEPLNTNMYSMVIYFVKPGDTLWKIAKQFKSKVQDIARINEIEDANKIYPGEQLYIPKFSKNRIAI